MLLVIGFFISIPFQHYFYAVTETVTVFTAQAAQFGYQEVYVNFYQGFFSPTVVSPIVSDIEADTNGRRMLLRMYVS